SPLVYGLYAIAIGGALALIARRRRPTTT
ncbi:MAG: hypothetical protein JWN62_2503, partial [Acidimicrobiales bacterium]|nr:hypothetical protein [Acidimicrobiales bacterium]